MCTRAKASAPSPIAVSAWSIHLGHPFIGGQLQMAGILDGKVAIITGAASGIGRATSQIFAREGAKLLLADVQEEGGYETVKMIKDAGGAAIFMKVDVSRWADVEAMVAKAVPTYGRLDCAFNNAGIDGKASRTHECTE